MTLYLESRTELILTNFTKLELGIGPLPFGTAGSSLIPSGAQFFSTPLMSSFTTEGPPVPP